MGDGPKQVICDQIEGKLKLDFTEQKLCAMITSYQRHYRQHDCLDLRLG